MTELNIKINIDYKYFNKTTDMSQLNRAFIFFIILNTNPY